MFGLLNLFVPRPRLRSDKFIGIGSHVQLKNNSWSGFKGCIVDMQHDHEGVLVFEVCLDPAAEGEPDGPIVPADMSQLESL